MLPGSSCCMVEFLGDRRVVERERAADLAEDLGRADRASPLLGIGQQRLHPQAFFAHPGWLVALRDSTQRGRLHTNPARCSASLTVSIPARCPVWVAR